MSDPSPSPRSAIFRPEALEHQARQKGPGDVLRGAPHWLDWAFYALIALVVGGLIVASTVEIDRYATGPTAVEEGRVVVFLPASLAPDVAPGQPVQLGDTTARVVSFRDRILYPAEAGLRGVEVSVPSVEVVTSAAEEADVGSARVLVESEPLIVAVIPGLNSLFGGD